MVKQTIVVFCFEKKYIIERIFPKLSVYQIKAFFEVGLKAFYSLKQPYKLKLLVLFQYNCILIKQEQKICFVSSIIINSTKKQNTEILLSILDTMEYVFLLVT